MSEIDAGVVRIDTERLALPTEAGIEIRVEDARLGLRRLADGSQDLVVGDAFGGVSVPWHLTTREAVREVERVLDDQGIYVLNMIDRPPLGFARAEVATLTEVFDHVALAARAGHAGAGPAAATWWRSPPTRRSTCRAIAAELAARGSDWGLITGAELAAWTDDAPVLTDDYAPVDQLLTPYSRRS